MKVKIYQLLLLLSILIQLPTCQQKPGNSVEASSVDSRPNILFILSDDHAVNAISAYGGMLAEFAKTTNIDLLASEGMRFDNVFCTNSICSPSRATILSGKY
ncbi:sulfatase-like hydrolase/transferase, partial [Flexithrix dorotheae]|uniref:sulfatase-like hydrolase/transferase n=1 Tax=Flexithrix dorotheae TaxID=70993 RepID=UPI0005C5F797